MIKNIEDIVNDENLKILDVLKYPIKSSKKIEIITDFDYNYDELIKNMLYTMHKSNAISISASSVGHFISLAVFNFDSPLVMINPTIISHSKDTVEIEEGTISIPGFFYKTKRYKKIDIAYQNDKGEHIHASMTDLYAVCVQHELDILQGKLYFDNLSVVKKFFELKKIKKHIKRQN